MRCYSKHYTLFPDLRAIPIFIFRFLAFSQPRDGDPRQNDDDAQNLSLAGSLVQKDGTEQEDPDKTGGSNAGQHLHRHADERYLVQRQGQEEQSVGHDDPDVQKLPNEPAFLLASGVGLLFEQNLTDSSDEHRRKGHHIAKSRGKLNVHRTYSPPFPQ